MNILRRFSFTAGLVVALLLAALAALGAETNSHGHTPPGKVFVYKTSHGQPQTMEVYFPKDFNPTKASVPGVLLFHGGSWTTGNLAQFRDICAYLARRGLVAATANYYMLPAAEQKGLGGKRKRVCVTDGTSALRWFKQHAADLGIDPNRVVIGGASAGGHIAMLATLNPGLADASDPKGIDTAVLGYLLFSAAFTADGRDQDDEVDVFAHLKPGMAPALFLFGEQDPWLPASEKLVAALHQKGNRAELRVADGVGHMFFLKQPWLDCSLVECDRFLVSLGVLQGEPLLQKPAGVDFDSQKSSP